MKKIAGIFLILLFFIPFCAYSDTPVSAALLIDTSKSIDKKSFKKGKKISRRIIDSLKADDDVIVISFDNTPNTVSGVNAGKSSTKDSISDLKRKGRYTTFYDALYDASDKLSETKHPGKVIIALTDGKDENSALLFDDALKKIHRENITVFCMSIGKVVVSQPLRRLSKLTGGKYLGSPEASEIDRVISKIRTTVGSKLEEQTKKKKSKKQPPLKKQKKKDEKEKLKEKKPSGFSEGYFWLIIAVILIAAAVVIYFIMRSSRDLEKCPRCGSTIPASFKECPYCEEQEDGELEEKLDKTVVERKPFDEESIDNTFVMTEKGFLVLETESGKKNEYPLEIMDSTYIGRADVNEIQIENETVSSQHCRIDHRKDKFRIYDLDSTNGTVLNGKKIERSDLQEGDEIQIGDLTFTFKIEKTT